MHGLSKIHLHPDEVLGFLKRRTRFKETYRSILYQKIIDQAAQERDIIVTEEEIQAEADHQRRDKQLEKAADTLAWLADEMITVKDWEAGIHEQLLTKKLTEQLFTKEVEKTYSQNRFDFEQVSLYQIVVPFERVAQELFYQIEEQEISFYEAAHFYDIDEKRRNHCGYEGKLHRWDLKPDIAAIVFSAQPKEVVGPFQTEEGYHLFLIEEVLPAELTPEKRQEILNEMFQDWLASELNYMLHNIS